MSLLRRLLTKLLLFPVVAFLLFEEWGWEPLAAAFAKLAGLAIWARLERHIRQLPPWAALLAFAAPMVLLLPVKLGALYLFSHGHWTQGLVLLLSAKLVGTALVARLFQLTQPSLLQIAWFARWYPRWKAWKDQLLGRVRQSSLWRQVQQAQGRAKALWRRLHP